MEENKKNPEISINELQTSIIQNNESVYHELHSIREEFNLSLKHLEDKLKIFKEECLRRGDDLDKDIDEVLSQIKAYSQEIVKFTISLDKIRNLIGNLNKQFCALEVKCSHNNDSLVGLQTKVQTLETNINNAYKLIINNVKNEKISSNKTNDDPDTVKINVKKGAVIFDFILKGGAIFVAAAILIGLILKFYTKL